MQPCQILASHGATDQLRTLILHSFNFKITVIYLSSSVVWLVGVGASYVCLLHKHCNTVPKVKNLFDRRESGDSHYFGVYG